MQTDSTYTKDQLKNLNDDEILLLLKKSWGIAENEPIEFVGRLSLISYSTGRYFGLKHALLSDGSLAEYPLAYSIDISIDHGIFLAHTNSTLMHFIEENQVVIMTCEVGLDTEQNRIKDDNPFRLKALTNSIKLVEKHSYKHDSSENDQKTFSQKSILEYIEKINAKELKSKIKILKQSEDNVQQEIAILEEKKSYLDVDIESKLNNIEDLYKELEKLTKKITQGKDLMSKNLEKLRGFIVNKAETLLNMEFINEEQYDILMENYQIEKDENDNLIDFQTDLNGDYLKAISHIQMYLYNKGIIYPKYILEDYFSLIQTNDLIILAGESGSGKTNLVKSFAEAVGGVSRIIPVKPNWTSSEDLLGYYNPLENKYLSTPFLDAILEASHNPNIPYFICLDEMNLARVEYYFADFLSKLEEREGETRIFLYSDTESGHVLSEFNNVLNTIESSKEKFKKNNLVKYIDILKDEDVNNELKRIFGFSDKDSLIKYHSDLRKMISGILDIPSSIVFPKNIRIIGAINIDETTHYLSPKVLDRAHVMKFDSPLLYDRQMISDERGSETDLNAKIKFSIDDFGTRKDYPRFDWDDEFCSIMAYLTEKYFVDMGVDVGFRTIRQGLNYREMLNSFQNRNDIFINNFILHKILPKFTFDGNSDVKGRKKIDILKDFREEIREIIGNDLRVSDVRNAIAELEDIIRKSPENDGIVNYWA